MTFSIMICDDLPEEQARMVRMLRSYEAAHGLELELETAPDGATLLSRWKPGRWDVVFLDIYMSAMDGVETARRLRAKDASCELVFVTTSREHGMEGYEVQAMDYLTKPYTQTDVDSAMDWFLHQRVEKRRTLLLRTQEGEESVPARDIRYIESRGHTCVVHAQGRLFSVRSSIDELAAGLDKAFYRCHKSFLLNFAHVTGVEPHSFLMDSGERVPISATNLSRSKAALLAWRSNTNL